MILEEASLLLSRCRREELMGVSTLATGGNAAAYQELGGGGEAAALGGRTSNPGGGESTAGVPLSWDRGEAGLSRNSRGLKGRVASKRVRSPGGSPTNATPAPPSDLQWIAPHRPSSSTGRECVDRKRRARPTSSATAGSTPPTDFCSSEDDQDGVGDPECCKGVSGVSPRQSDCVARRPGESGNEKAVGHSQMSSDLIWRSVANGDVSGGKSGADHLLGYDSRGSSVGKSMPQMGWHFPQAKVPPMSPPPMSPPPPSPLVTPASDSVPASPVAAAAASSPEDEIFFADHPLDPRTRSSWPRSTLGHEEELEGTLNEVVASGIVVHPRAQGIGTRGRGVSVAEFPGGSGGGKSACRGNDQGSGDGNDDGDGDDEVGYPNSSQPASSGTGGSSSAALVESTFEWEVQPETMAAYFTSVIGLIPPSAGGNPSLQARRMSARAMRADAAEAKDEPSSVFGVAPAVAGGDEADACPEPCNDSPSKQSCNSSAVVEPSWVSESWIEEESGEGVEGGGGGSSLGW